VTAPLPVRAGVVGLTRALCDLPSVSGDERMLAAALEATLRAEAPHLEVTRDGDAIVARTQLDRAQRVIVAGHIDTVPINDNLPTRLDGDEFTGTLWGRGTVDMKGGVAVALALAVELTEPVHDVTWVWYDHEEVEATLNGLGRLARTHPELLAADFAILGEPSNGVVEGGCNGTLRVELRATGRRAHSARSWMGINAIHALEPALAALAAYEPATVEVDGLAYREGLNARNDNDSYAKVRVGIITNEQNNCNTPDAWLGVGGDYPGGCGIATDGTVGNFAGCQADNGTQNLYAFALVFVR